MPMRVEVRMPYDGDMTMDLSGSDFEIYMIRAYETSGEELMDANPAPSALTVHDLSHAQDYWFVIEGADGVHSGTFDIQIECSSDAPTRSPTSNPTANPSTELSIEELYFTWCK